MVDRRSEIGSPAWIESFQRKLQDRARLGRYTRLRSVSPSLPEFVPGNQAFYLHDGQLHLDWMVAAIESARYRVDLEMYIFSNDESGRRVRDALVHAAKRGVVVRVLYDSIGSGEAGHSFFQPLVEAGARVVEFNPVAPWRLRMGRLGRTQHWQPNNRDHRKLLVCDTPVSWARASYREGEVPCCPEPDDPDRGAIAITGGRNIGDEYLGAPLGAGQWRDCGVVIFGPVVRHLGELFDAMWFHAEGPDVEPPRIDSERVGDLTILPIGSQPGFMNLLSWALSRMAATIRSELRISCAYFIPSARWRRSLAAAARRTGRCLILLPKSSDVAMVDRASRHLWGRLLDAGVEIYRYSRGVLHEKTLVYDKTVTVVGSSNLDPRSFRLNYELSVIIVGASFAAPVVAWHEGDLASAERYTLALWRDRPWLERLGDWLWSLLRSQL
ncbi:MAG: phospholipase D-like domain-containing protein [Polyangiaceae bacterium]